MISIPSFIPDMLGTTFSDRGVKVRKISFVFMLCFLVIACRTAPVQDPFVSGEMSYSSGDYATAIKEFHKSAEQGNVAAENYLGLMYRNGQSVKNDDIEAVKWWRKAADKGYVKSQAHLGYMYREGRGVPQDYVLAEQWYRKAAEQGDAGAQHNLGWLYYSGKGVEQNHDEALRWYLLAAEQGFINAQYNLGVMFSTGSGVAQDYVEATKWWQLAAFQGDDMADKQVDILEGKMTFEQIDEATKRVLEYPLLMLPGETAGK